MHPITTGGEWGDALLLLGCADALRVLLLRFCRARRAFNETILFSSLDLQLV